MKKNKPPYLTKWLLDLISKSDEKNTVAGDIEEYYHEIYQNESALKAKFWYWSQFFKTLSKFIYHSFYSSSAMFKNYLKAAFRNIKRQKGYSFINIFGLAAGMAVCLLILLYVNFELSYDRYHENSDRIYRINNSYKVGNTTRNNANVTGALGPAVAEELPGIESCVRIFNPLMFENGLVVKYGEEKLEESSILSAGPNFFSFFKYEFIEGNPETALREPGSVVITSKTASRLFGNDNPVGKTINIDFHWFGSSVFIITGVIKNVPENSHFSFNYMLSLSSLSTEMFGLINQWDRIPANTYLLLRKDINIKDIEERINQIYNQNTQVSTAGGISDKKVFLQKMTDIHLKSHLLGELGANSYIGYVYSFSVIALIILIIACINFMNLMTARSSNRAREIGMRKVIGACRRQLIRQFITESILFAFLGLISALIMVYFLIPVFNNISELSLSFNYLLNFKIISVMAAMVILTGVLSGSYPAFFLSSIEPAAILKGMSAGGLKKAFFRKGLIIFQFTISAVMIAGTIVVSKQLHFVKNKNLGFKKEQILVVHVKERSNQGKGEIIRDAFLKNPNVIEAVVSSSVPGSKMNVLYARPEGFEDDGRFVIRILAVDYNFLPFYKIKLLEGRNFSPDYTTDNRACIINETAVNELGWNNITIGKKIQSVYHNREFLNVIGVIKDFHQFSLNTKIEPMILFLRSSNYPLFLSLKVNIRNLSNTIGYLKEVMDDFEPGRNLEYFFLDEYFNRQYRKDEKISTIFNYFSVITIIIACLGLISMAVYIAEQSKKEISIRKVLGAAAGGLILKFLKGFAVNVIIANIIAAPLAYILIKRYWLSEFPYRINITLWTFLFTALISLCIAVLSVGFQAFKAVSVNPVDNLRNE